MRFIDKSSRRQEGELIITEFLKCFYRRKAAYPDDSYAAFSKEIDDNHGHTKFRKRLVDEVLMPEQEGRCCYCMRKLSRSICTIEHIIPNHIDNILEFGRYRIRDTELRRLIYSEDFKSRTPNPDPPHPHSIAYQNLVLSCNGNLFNETPYPICCNLKRGDAFLHPFILYHNIIDTFAYTVDGLAEWTEDPEPPESENNAMKILGLNDLMLKMIRRIWFFCKDNGLDPLRDGKSVVVNTLFGYLASDSNDMQELETLLNFKNEKYWNLLLEYDAFANIRHI